MQRDIVTSIDFLRVPSTPADPNNLQDQRIATDLVDTLDANRARCVGMAANMIGERKRIIAFVDEDFGGKITVMYNPSISSREGEFDTAEGCLSLEGERRTQRARRIEVDYCSPTARARHATFTGWTAQIIQHEIDHCEGIII